MCPYGLRHVMLACLRDELRPLDTEKKYFCSPASSHIRYINELVFRMIATDIHFFSQKEL